MDLLNFREKIIRENFGFSKEKEKIFCFVDFSNVNKWFAEDRQNSDGSLLLDNEMITIDLEKLKEFLSIFSDDIRFYYGHNVGNSGSMSFLRKTRYVFGKNRVFTKPIQQIRHQLGNDEKLLNSRDIFNNKEGEYILLPKCNFDVEISVDAIKLISKYDVFCLLSGDADFIYLNKYLKNQNKKIILIKGGYITQQLRKSTNLIINAQDIKNYITKIKQKPGD